MDNRKVYEEKVSVYIERLIDKTKANEIEWDQHNPTTFSYTKLKGNSEIIITIQSIESGLFGQRFVFSVEDKDSSCKRKTISIDSTDNTVITASGFIATLNASLDPTQNVSHKSEFHSKIKELYSTIWDCYYQNANDLLDTLIDDL